MLSLLQVTDPPAPSRKSATSEADLTESAMSQIGIGSYKYFIAIDFGTHGSGFAYSSASDSDSAVRTFEYWPGQRGSPAPKTRTALLYKRSNLAKPQAWGWEAISMYTDLPETERVNFILLESFKLYLMPEEFQGLPQLPAGLTIRFVTLYVDSMLCCIWQIFELTPLLSEQGLHIQDADMTFTGTPAILLAAE